MAAAASVAGDLLSAAVAAVVVAPVVVVADAVVLVAPLLEAEAMEVNADLFRLNPEYRQWDGFWVPQTENRTTEQGVERAAKGLGLVTVGIMSHVRNGVSWNTNCTSNAATTHGELPRLVGNMSSRWAFVKCRVASMDTCARITTTARWSPVAMHGESVVIRMTRLRRRILKSAIGSQPLSGAQG